MKKINKLLQHVNAAIVDYVSENPIARRDTEILNELYLLLVTVNNKSLAGDIVLIIANIMLGYYEMDEHWIIVDPGKFEKEMFYTPYFYDQYQLTNSGHSNDFIKMNEAEKYIVSLFDTGNKDATHFTVVENNDGFVAIKFKNMDTGG